MPRRPTPALFALALAIAGAPALADDIVRDPALFETFEIEGVTMAMAPEEAVDRLFAAGYTAGDITSSDDWYETGISMVRGSWDTPEGESWVTLDRRGDMLVAISQNFTRTRGARFDPDAEIGALRAHYGIASDEPDCHVNDFNTGVCELRDAVEDEDVDYVSTTTAQPTMLIQTITRLKHLRFD